MRDSLGTNVMPGEKVAFFTGGGSGSRLLTPTVAEVLTVTDKSARVRILEVGRDYNPAVRVGEEMTAMPSRVVSMGSLM